MKKQKIFIFITAAALLLGCGTTAYAAPEIMPDGKVFDAEYYALTNPDVAAALGMDTDALYLHYTTFGQSEGRLATNPDDAAKVALLQNSVRKITISFAGDCTLGTFKGQSWNLFTDYYNKFGPDYFFKNVRNIFAQDDITFVNLEGALTSHPQVVEKKFPIKGNPEYAAILSGSSVEVVNLANNHTFDCGQIGYDECKQILTDNNISYCDDSYACTIDANGVRTGFIGLNCWGMSPALARQLQNMINDLRSRGCSVVCVMFHGSKEYEFTSNATTESFAHTAIDLGADIVVGAHPHVIQGIELYKGKVICYSLGNFSFGANQNPKDKDTFIFQQTFLVDAAGTVKYGESKVIPCKISSTDALNDYCPMPQTGAEAARITQRLATYSAKYPVSFFD